MKVIHSSYTHLVPSLTASRNGSSHVDEVKSNFISSGPLTKKQCATRTNGSKTYEEPETLRYIRESRRKTLSDKNIQTEHGVLYSES